MKIFHLNNPASGGGHGKKYYPLINNYINSKKFDCTSMQTEYAGHGTTIIQELDFEKYDALLVSGGDGTIFEAINGFFKNDSEKRIPISVIPIGRGNAFARDINLLPESWKNGIDIIKKGQTKKIDVAKFTTQDETFYFVNILGFGFVTDVAQTAFKLRMFGHLSYIIGVLYRTINLKSYRLKMEIDGEMIERDNIFAEISNTRYTGKDFFMAPTASVDDGLLDVTLLNDLSRVRLLQCLPKIFKGTHIQMKEVETFKAKHIKIETDPIKILTPDGQLMGSTPIEITCLPKTLEVFFR